MMKGCPDNVGPWLKRRNICRLAKPTRDLASLIGHKTSYGLSCTPTVWASVSLSAHAKTFSLDPANEEVSLQDLVKDVDNGILFFGNGSWSIDQQRFNFQFGGQTFWEIKQGKIGGMLRDVAYQFAHHRFLERLRRFWAAKKHLRTKTALPTMAKARPTQAQCP